MMPIYFYQNLHSQPDCTLFSFPYAPKKNMNLKQIYFIMTRHRTNKTSNNFITSVQIALL